MHYGRYGADAEDSRLPPLFLGYQGLVRGYDFGSFDANECASLDMTSCEAFDQLNGSRVAIGGAELRFPLLGLFSRKSYYGAFPIEMALFADAGLAWTSDHQAALRRRRARLGAQRRRRSARQPPRIRDRGNRLRPPARSLAAGLAVAVWADAGILKPKGSTEARKHGEVLKCQCCERL